MPTEWLSLKSVGSDLTDFSFSFLLDFSKTHVRVLSTEENVDELELMKKQYYIK